MSDTKLMEIPIITQEHNALSKRFAINNDLSVTAIATATACDPAPVPFWDGNDDEWQKRLQGCAATLLNASNGEIVRTTAVAEEPYVLSVARLSSKSSSSSSSSSSLLSLVEIDLSHLDSSVLGNIIKTFIFIDAEELEEDEDFMDTGDDDGPSGSKMDHQFYKILLVDDQANVLMFQIQLNQGTGTTVPLHSVQNVSTEDILSKQNTRIHPHSRYYNLTSSQVVALDSSRIIVALSPYILCINVNTGTATSWSKESCLYNRRKSISGVLKSAGGMLLGKASDEMEEEFVDEDTVGSIIMPSTAVLCAFRVGEDPEDDEEDDDDFMMSSSSGGGGSGVNTLVCSLHADGTIRLWTLSPRYQNFTYPKQMTMLNGGGSGSMPMMPPPHTWSSSSDSLSIEGHAYVDPSTGETGLVLAVNIRVAERMGVNRVSSPCHLMTLMGTLGGGGGGEMNHMQISKVVVPDAVDSMKAMNFIRCGASWELHTLALSVPERSVFAERSLYASLAHVPLRKTMLVVYGPQSPQPLAVQSANTLDDIAEQEREKIIHECRIISGGGILDDNDEKDYVGGKDYHLRRLDAWYLKRIFRSDTVQTVGLSNATIGTIRRALRQVIPSLCFDEDTKNVTIELETLTMMNKWAKFEETRSSADTLRNGRGGGSSALSDQFYSPSPKRQHKRAKHTPSRGVSTYRSFMQEPLSPSITPEIRDDSSSDDGNAMDGSKRLVQEHHSRWRKLLFAIYHEESKLLAPVAFGSFHQMVKNENGGSERVNVLVRCGTTSTTVMSRDAQHDNLTALDAALVKMLENLERDSDNKEMVVALESKIWCLISGAKLIFDEERDSLISFVNEIIARIDVEGWEDLSRQISGILNTISDDDLKSWLSTPLSSSFVLGSVELGNNGGVHCHDMDVSVLLPCAFRLSQQYLAACRRLALARYLCIVQVEAKGFNLFGADAERISLVTYLHTVATIWACIQKVPKSSEHVKESRKGSLTRAPPSMAFSASSTSLSSAAEQSVIKSRASSSLSSRGKYSHSSVLGTVLSQIFKTKQRNAAMSRDSFIVDISKALVINAFPMNEEGGGLPELEILSPTGILEKSRLYLRLLSPYIAFLPSHPKAKNRTKLAANGLLSEVDFLAKTDRLNMERITELQEHASHLLKRGPSLMANATYLGIFFKTMTDLPENWSSNRTVSESYFDTTLTETLRTIFNEPSAQYIHVSDGDIRSLSKMETVKTLFLPWITASMNNNSNPVRMIIESLAPFVQGDAQVEVMQHSLKVLLLISSLLERKAILENHSSSSLHPKTRGPFAKVLIAAINDVIENIQNHARAEDYGHFQEYAAIWSSLFRHALQGRCWDDAFDSCLSNPVKDRRVKNFKRFVLAIVKAGALDSLLNKMTFAVIDDSEEDAPIDLYELASRTLSDAAIQRASSEIDKFCDSSLSDVDYRGCLYSLHAAYGNWRRSCQALDFLAEETAVRRLDANNVLGDTSKAEESDIQNINSQVMDDLVLSAVASAQLIQLVEGPDQRYFVSGEVTTVPPPELSAREDLKAKKSSQSGTDLVDQYNDDESLDRASRLYTEKKLLLRAKRLISLHTLQKDAYAPDSPLDIFQSSDTAIIDALSRLGYYHHAISFARCKQENKEGGKIAGRDLLIDAVCHMLHNCLTPVAVNLSRAPLSEEAEIDLEAQGNIISRPTMNQLRLLTNDGQLSRPSDSWHPLEISTDVERGTCSLNLLRLYVECFSKEDNKVAIELAEKLLDLHEAKVKLPQWLHALILGENQSDGLFANNGGGNPTALLNLFIKNGLYLDACQLVCQVLLGGTDREQKATSRLPEKGHIDYVPYDVIDRLWNLIETHVQSSYPSNSKENQELLDARKSVEMALEKHFQLMHVSEIGMLSARALNARKF